MNLARAMVKRLSTKQETIELPSKFFTEFLQQLNVQALPGQLVVCKVCFDGAKYKDLSSEEQALYATLFGTTEDFPSESLSVIALLSGGRAGKTYIFIALRLLWGAMTRDLSTLAPGQKAVALNVAPNEMLRQEIINYAAGALANSQWRSWIRLPKGAKIGDNVSGFGIERPDGHVRYEASVAAAGGYGGRGRSLTDFAMDEACFFRSASFVVNDEDIFKGASPRVLPGGQSIVASTPWAKTGLLYDLYEKNFARPSTAVVVHAPTLALHNTEFTRNLVAREYERDEENARREFGAEFLGADSATFFDAVTFRFTDDFELPRPGERVSVGVDLGFRNDSSALVVACHGPDSIRILPPIELRPQQGKPLVPSEVCKVFAKEAKRVGATFILADQHYRDTLSEVLKEADIVCSPAPVKPSEAFVRTRVLLQQGKLFLPAGFDRLTKQLKEVKGTATSGGGITISQPRRSGHGDMVSALVLAVWYKRGAEQFDQAPESMVEKEKRFAQFAKKKDTRWKR